MVQLINLSSANDQLTKTMNVMQFLEKSFVFKGLKQNDLKKLINIFSAAKYSPGEYIFKQGEIGDHLIMVAEGVISFYNTKKDGSEALVRKLGQFEVVGENSLVHEGHRLAASVKAFDVVTVLILKKEIYDKVKQQKYMAPINARIEAARRKMIRDGIRKIPFMKGLDDDDLEAFQLEDYPPGVALCEEGEVGDKFYILLSGQVVVTVRDKLGLNIEIARMDPIDYPVSFGEKALVTDEPRNATITTLKQSTVFSIGKAQFQRILQKNSTVQRSIEDMVAKSNLGNYFANKVPIFSEMSLNNQRLLAVVATFASFEPGEYVKQEGTVSSRSFYLITAGSAEVYVGGEKVNTLGEGDYFGEVGLVSNRPSSATIRVSDSGPLSCLAVSSEDFHRILASETAFLAQLKIRVEGSKCTLEDLLQHPKGRESFLLHCQQEYAKENVDFWQDVLELENIQRRRIRKSILKAMKINPDSVREKKKSMLRERASHIYNKYLKENAEEEINLPADIRARLMKRFDDDDLSFDMFEEAKNSIYSLIEQDNFTRYKASEAFTQLLAEIGMYRT